jgi:hypothetical protein
MESKPSTALPENQVKIAVLLALGAIVAPPLLAAFLVRQNSKG